MGPHQSSSPSDQGRSTPSQATTTAQLQTDSDSGPLSVASAVVMSPLARLVAAAVVGLTLAVMLVGVVFDVQFLRGTAVSVFLLLELGIAPTLLMRPMTTMWFAFRAIVGGLTTTIIVGFTMSVLHFWHPVELFLLTIATTLAILVLAVRRDLREMPADWTATRKPISEAAWRVNGTVAAGLAIVTIVAVVNRTTPESGGLISTLGLAWWVGLAVVVGGMVWAWKAGVSPAFAVLVLAGVVVFSQALTYGAPAVMSAARHVGFVDFIRVNHGVRIESDIFQAWSGLFAGIAWVCDAAGISDPMVIATWWPVVVSPVIALATAVMASRWVTGNFRVWFAGGVFVLTSTLNVIYFSPQSVGLLLAVAVFALAVTPRVDADPAGDENPERDIPTVEGAAPHQEGASTVDVRPAGTEHGRRLGLSRVAFIFYLACGMAVTHQISPYLAVAALVVLAIFGFVRPWWLPLVVLLPAVTWALLNRGVLGGFVSLGAIGRLWDNVQPPVHSFAQFPQPLITRLAFNVPALILFLLGLVALIHALRVRSRASWALLIAAASPASLFAATDYGQEGIFRVTLFAGPWLAVLAAGFVWKRSRISLAALSAVLVVLLGVNAFGQTALDWNRMVRQDTAVATRLYETTAQDGSVLMTAGTINATPLGISARYQDVVYLSRETLGGYPPVEAPYDAADDVTQLTKALVTGYSATQYYALVSDSIGAYDERYGYQHYDQFLQLTAAMAQSPLWEPIFEGPTTTLYVLRDPAAVAANP